jgi:hypothetical protein
MPREHRERPGNIGTARQAYILSTAPFSGQDDKSGCFTSDLYDDGEEERDASASPPLPHHMILSLFFPGPSLQPWKHWWRLAVPRALF